MAGQGLDTSLVNKAKDIAFNRGVIKKVGILEAEIKSLKGLTSKVATFDNLSSVLNNKIKELDAVIESVGKMDTLSEKFEKLKTISKMVGQHEGKLNKLKEIDTLNSELKKVNLKLVDLDQLTSIKDRLTNLENKTL